MFGKYALISGAAMLALSGCLTTTSKGTGGSEATGSASLSGAPQEAAADLPRCKAPIGTLALVEGQYPGLSSHGLSSPIPVLRLMVQQSGCFNIVDRGQALTRIQQEQELTGKGGSSKSLVAAQYFLTPEIIFADSNAGGTSASVATFSSLLPGSLRGLASDVGFTDQQVQTTLFVTQTSTSLQVAAAEGSAQTRDWSFGAAGWASGFTSARFGSYADTAVGKTVVAALADAYGKLVRQLQAS